QAMDPATLRPLRGQSGLRLDKEGRFWHRGGLVEHARTLAALHQGIHRAADGRWATRIGKDWAYLDVEDAALWLRRIEPSGASLRGQLASGEWVEIDPATGAAGGREPPMPSTRASEASARGSRGMRSSRSASPCPRTGNISCSSSARAGSASAQTPARHPAAPGGRGA